MALLLAQAKTRVCRGRSPLPGYGVSPSNPLFPSRRRRHTLQTKFDKIPRDFVRRERINLLMFSEDQEAHLEQYRFEKYLLDLCIVTMEQGGVTSNVRTRQFLPPIDAWGVPKYPEKTLILPPGTNLLPSL